MNNPMNTLVMVAFLASLVPGGLTHPSELRHSMNTPDLSTQTGRQDSAAVRLTVVYDNNPLVAGLTTAWGFGCFVELNGTRILFDTGGEGDVLLNNMAKLGISPESIDAVVISHIHHDHLGGLNDLLRKNSRLKVYVPETFPPEVCRDIESTGAKVIRTRSSEQINSHISTLGIYGGSIPEQALVVRTVNGIVVITGCAHPGIVNIVRKAHSAFPAEPVYLVMGGFHLRGLSSGEISGIVAAFKKLGVQKVAPCHCSGDQAREMFKKAYGQDYVEMGVGGKIDIA
jgi:7,8-dihydropterin-6-yl-methyl-4-(beta-D-ribofuranosyl)aminobenzene 5'-phosphate synthase